MYKSSEDLVQRIIGLLQSENKIDFDEQDIRIVYKILSSAHCRKECDDLIDKEISGQKIAFLLTSYHVVKEIIINQQYDELSVQLQRQYSRSFRLFPAFL